MIASALAGGPGPIIGLALFGSRVRRHQLYNKQVLGVTISGDKVHSVPFVVIVNHET
jgi:hypothetical protein